MTNRLTATQLIVPVLLAAGVAGYFLSDRGSAPPSASAADVAVAPVASAEPASSVPAAALPPGHPAVGATPPHGKGPHGAGPHGGMQGGATGVVDDAPSIAWTVPAEWKTVANPSPMRVATFKASDTMEVSVARAGGTVDANIQRWKTQFDGAPAVERSDKTVHGLKVTVVHIGGVFLGTGMNSKEPERHERWAMLAAIVESNGAPYFFKLVGPSDQVDAAKPAFGALVDSVTPLAAK